MAKLANLPDSLIERASEILQQLELGEEQVAAEKAPLVEQTTGQLAFFVEESSPNKSGTEQTYERLIQKLKNLDLFAMTPLDAMNELYRLQKEAKRLSD